MGKRILLLLILFLFSGAIYGQIRLTQIEPIQGTVIKSQGEAASKVLTTNGAGGASWQPQVDVSNITITHEITQTSHALSVGNAIYLNSSYYKAKADTSLTSDVVGIVTAVISANVFVYTSAGVIAGSYTKGENYYLSNSVAGAIIPEPTYNLWDVRQFIGTGLDGGKLLLEIDLGHEITGVGSGGSYTETDPVFGVHTAKNIANGTGFLKNNGAGTWSYINATYLTAEVDGSITNEIQNLGYTSSTRTITIDGTGSADVVLPLFSSTIAGLTPFSGGGTTNFLRADGAWTAPTYTTPNYQINTVQSGAKTANWTHNAILGDIGAYRVNLAASTISIHNLSSGMQGTIFLNFVTTTPTAITVNTFSDAGTTGLTEIVLGAAVEFAINKSTSITYTCANDGTNTYVYLVYGKEE